MNTASPISGSPIASNATPAVRPTSSAITLIGQSFKQYKIKMSKAWVIYNFNNYYFTELQKLIKQDQLPEFKFSYFNHEAEHSYKKKNLFGLISQSVDVINPKRTLIEMVSLTEHYLQELTETVYTEHPIKLKGSSNKNDAKDEQPDRQQKLISLILESADKEEMLSKIIEEKVRNIFYGNPIDFFTKDKAKIGIGNFFESNHLERMKIYAEIIARRNVLIHNNSRVDRKYLREVENSQYKLGNKVEIDKEYLREAGIILRGYACIVTKLVLERTFKATYVSRHIMKMYKSFHNMYNNIGISGSSPSNSTATSSPSALVASTTASSPSSSPDSTVSATNTPPPSPLPPI